MSIRFASSSSIDDLESANLRCAFVNRLPHAAFDATERQFCDLLDAGSSEHIIEVHRYAMDTVPRGDVTAARIVGL